jgi:ribosomal protein S18 acetylase RimI-like enzyme
MRCIEHTGAKDFLDSVGSYLLEEEAVNGLILGLADAAAAEEPSASVAQSRWFSCVNHKRLLLAANANPINIVLSHGDVKLVPVLIEGLRAEKIRPPGVVGPAHLADAAKDRWKEALGCEIGVGTEQGLYELRVVSPPTEVSGCARSATAKDLSLLVEWTRAFHQEAVSDAQPDDERLRERVAAKIARDWYFLWTAADEPVSMAALARPTPNGFSVNCVYTPPAHRNRGYASAITAHTSATGLGRGKDFCVLYTDLSNPTSNSIYQKIGYRRIGDSRHWRFHYP